jgi:hypothetical protein
MSHKITVDGEFGSVDFLKEELDSRKVSYNESNENGETYLTFPQRTVYGNPLKICVSNPQKSSMDSDLGREVGSWYQGSMVRHLRYTLAMQGSTIQSESKVGNDIVLMVAVG